MRILLVICVLASAYAAPAERIIRNILPGDPRYDPHSHHHHEDHEHHQNEVETAKALQSAFSDFKFGSLGSTTGSPPDFSDYFKYDFGTGVSNFNPDIVNVGGAKSKSVTESSAVNPPKVDSVSLIETAPAAPAESAVEQRSQKNSDVEAAKSTDTSSGISQPTVKPTDAELKSSGRSLISSEAGFFSDSLSNPFRSTFDLSSSFDSDFGSSLGQQSFGSGFESFDQSSFGPSFRSGLNTDYGFGDVNYPLGFGTYSGFEQLPQGRVIDSELSASFPQFNPVEYNRNLGYLNSPYSFNFAPEAVTASPFPSLLSVTQPPSTLTKSSSVSIEKSVEPKIKISEGSSSGKV